MKSLTPEGDIVLVVDDSPGSLGFITQALEEAGVTVLVATNGQTALDITEQVMPDVILLDAVMPGLDGFEVCRRLKASTKLAHIPVIFMTALTETEHLVHALEVGGVDYLSKPINLEELRARMRVHLANARRTQSARLALDAAGRHLIAFSVAGKALWSTPQVARLMNSANVPDDMATLIEDQVRLWLKTHRDNLATGSSFTVSLRQAGSADLVYLGTIAANEYLFRLISESGVNQEEALRQHFGLTARESEVLIWIARGKSNRDIGQVLNLSPRTVNKHLEQVYIKLGVENRASAAVKAIHVLGSGTN